MKKTLVPWTPRFPHGMRGLGRELEGLFDWGLLEEENGGWLADFAPVVDVTEDQNNYEITAELPGLKPEDINVELDNGVLTISGHREEEEKKKGKTFHRVERRYGSFRRSMALPQAGAAENVTAGYKDGVLTVAVAKQKSARAKKVEVNGS